MFIFFIIIIVIMLYIYMHVLYIYIYLMRTNWIMLLIHLEHTFFLFCCCCFIFPLSYLWIFVLYFISLVYTFFRKYTYMYIIYTWNFHPDGCIFFRFGVPQLSLLLFFFFLLYRMCVCSFHPSDPLFRIRVVTVTAYIF